MSILSALLAILGCKNKNQKENSEFKSEQPEGFTEIKTGDSGNVQLNIEHDSTYFLPIIRNFKDEDLACQTIVYEKLGKNIGAFLAKVEVKPDGRTGINYVLKSHLEKYKISEKDILNIGLHNLANAKLKIEGMNDSITGDNMVSITSELGLATSILFDFNFIDKIKTDLNAKELHVTIINSGTVFLTTPNNSFEAGFKEIALETNYNDVININSATYLWKNHSLELIKMYRE